MDIIKLNLATTELSLLYDDSVGIRYLVDFEGFSLKHFFKWNPLVMNKHIRLIELAYSNRLLGLDFVNSPEYVTKILAAVKLILRPKIYKRINIHKDLESVHQIIPKECLPVEYKGSCGKIPDMLQKWDEAFRNHRHFFVGNYKNISLEHLRPLDTSESEHFGPEGTFKKMMID